MKLIGKGLFSKVYQDPQNADFVVIHSQDPVKECFAFGWGNDGELFPEIERIDCEVYRMKRYDKVRAVKPNLNKHQYALYMALRDVSSSFSARGFDGLHKAFAALPDQFEDEREQLREALDGLANYGLDIQFEISPRNIAIDNGKLVLLDVFFFAKAAANMRKTGSVN